MVRFSSDDDVRRLGEEVILLLGGDEDGRAARHAHHLRVADPAGRGDERLIARVEQGKEGIEQGLLGAVGDDNGAIVAQFMRQQAIRPIVSCNAESASRPASPTASLGIMLNHSFAKKSGSTQKSFRNRTLSEKDKNGYMHSEVGNR